jgi:predicted permease
VRQRVGERVGALLSWLYPPAFRRVHGAGMQQFARTALGRRDVGPAALIVDMLRGAVVEWLSLMRSHEHAGMSRPARGEHMRNLTRDIAHAARRLWKSPGFTIAAVLTLALGIGANTAIFTLAYATVLRPVQVYRPEQLVTVPWSSSYPDYAEYSGRTDIFTGVAAIAGAGRANITSDDSSDLAEMVFVTGNTFDVLGVRAAIGRTLLPADDVLNGPQVAVLAHDYWRSRFGGDSGVIGRTIRINSKPVTIVGVAEKGFRGTRLSSNPALFAPLSSVQVLQTGFLSKVAFRTSRGFVWLTAIARLRNDVPWARAEAEMDAMYRRQHPPEPGEPAERLTFDPLTNRALGREAALTRQFVTLLFGVVGIILLIGCANLANLLLARAAARRGEIGIRLALGATRARIVTQMLVESTLLASLGGTVGLAVAAVCLQAFSAYQLPGNLDLSKIPLQVSATSLAVTSALSLVTGLLFGAAPAWRASRTDVLTSLSAQSRSATRRGHLRSVLLGSQVAMSLVLLTGAGLFTRSLVAALDVPLGFDVTGVTTASVNLGLARYDNARAEAFYTSALASLLALPQVESAAWSTTVPTAGGRWSEVSIEGYQPSPQEDVTVAMAHVTPQYFRTAGMRVTEGRDFSAADVHGTPLVAVVNRTMADKYWRGRSAIGGRMKLFKGPDVTVIGVTGDTVVREIGEKKEPFVYLAFHQWLDGRETVAIDPAHLFVRLRDDGSDGLSLVRDCLRNIDPQLPLYDVQPFEERVRGLLMPQRLGVTLFLFASSLALALAVVGIYGVARYVATTRTREIGLRIALGATRSGITIMVLSEGARPVAVGILAGLVVALGSARFLSAFLLGVTPLDPATFGGVTLLMIAISAAATYLPARRAARVEPVSALRTE